MGVQYRPLGMIKETLEQIGIEVTYAYEDLIFIQHNHFLLQFGKVGEILFYSANVAATEAEAQQFFTAVQAAVSGKGITLLRRGPYQLTADADENLSLHFLDDAPPQHQ
jgi:hypothetical protein